MVSLSLRRAPPLAQLRVTPSRATYGAGLPTGRTMPGLLTLSRRLSAPIQMRSELERGDDDACLIHCRFIWGAPRYDNFGFDVSRGARAADFILAHRATATRSRPRH